MGGGGKGTATRWLGPRVKGASWNTALSYNTNVLSISRCKQDIINC